MQLTKIKSGALAFILPTLLLISGFTGCSDDGAQPVVPPSELTLRKDIVGPDETSQFIEVKTEGSWKINLVYEFDEDDEEREQWASLSTYRGEGNRNDIVLSYDSNPRGVDRMVTLVLTTDNDRVETLLTQEGRYVPNTITVSLRRNEVAANERSQLVRVVCTDDWTLSIEYPEDGPAGWASVDPESGTGSKNDIVLNYEANESTESDRNLTLVLVSGSRESRATLTQLKKTGSEGEILEVDLSAEEAGATETSQTVHVNAEGEWTLSLQYLSGGSGWSSLSSTSGTGSASLTMTYSENTSESDRQVKLTVTSTATGKQDSATFTQKGKTPVIVNDNWLELPDISSIGSNEMFVTHNTTISGKQMRSFSMLYDTKERIAYWVAYPHHSVYMGSSGRTDAWQYDPKVPQSQQANLSKGMSGYDRGHQIPSADRTADKSTNAQTFYYTNMTPQLGTLNQRMWASLENQVRDWTKGTGSYERPDTMYVVTGAILRTVGGNESVKYATDRSGDKIAVPNYYYKVLLHRRNNTYRTVGFWFEHRSYGTGNATRAQTKTVREIEKLTGYDFFSNLPREVQDEIENDITYSAWGL